MISVIIPLYNKEVYIKETIESVLNQTFQSFEIIVVNDGSNDGGPAIVNAFNDERIKLISTANGGVSSARNIGVAKSNYEFVAFLDADDKWLPNHLENINNLIVLYGKVADVFVTNYARKYPNGKILPNRTESELPTGVVKNFFQVYFKKVLIHTSCVCIRKSVFDNLGGFDVRLTNGEDKQLWWRLGKHYSVAYSHKATEIYLVDAINNSSRKIRVDKTFGYYVSVFDSSSFFEFLIKAREKLKFYVKFFFNKYD